MLNTFVKIESLEVDDIAPAERTANARRVDKVSALPHVQRAGQPASACRPPRTSNGASDYSNGDFHATAARRHLRARYRAVKMDIAEGKEVFTTLDSARFNHVFGNVEHLYTEVKCAREQIADAEALLDISASFLSSIKDVKRGTGVTPSELVTGMLTNFGIVAVLTEERPNFVVDWEGLGRVATVVLSDAPSMPTMLGPMDIQTKQRKIPQRRPRDRPVENARPEELHESTDDRTETDKNMETMFGILRQLKAVRLESLVLNRSSFSQTVENLFALSFLVKDGRAKISINDGYHFVGPMNFPSQKQRERGEGCMSQFVFRFDFKDWQVMKDMVEEGRELMPHRDSSGSASLVSKNYRNRANERVECELDQNSTGDDDGYDEPPARKRRRVPDGGF